MNNQKGFALIAALGIMVIGSLMLAAIFPLVTNGLIMSVGNTDRVAAQYAAEAGAKRAVAMFYRDVQNWSWLDQSEGSPNWHNLNDSVNERYHVKIALISKDGAIVVPVAPAVAGEYFVISTGQVNDAVARVSAKVTIESNHSGGGIEGLDQIDHNSPAYYTVYAGGAITFNGNVAVNGRPVGAEGAIVGGNGPPMFLSYVRDNNPQFKSIPPYSTLLSNVVKNETVVNFDHNSSIYKKNKGYEITSSDSNKTYIFKTNDMVIINKNTNLNNITIIAGGALEIEQNANLSNCRVLSGAEVRIKDNNGKNGGQNINNSLIVSAGSMTASGGPGFANSIIFCYGSFTANGGTNLNQGRIIVAGSAAFNGGGNLNYGGNINAFFSGGGDGEESSITISTWESI